MLVNRYFDDQVLSLGFENSNGRSSVGLMAPGSYEFSTADNERMVIISGALLVRRKSDEEPVLYSDGEEFHVPMNEKFHVDASEPTAYLCVYTQ